MVTISELLYFITNHRFLTIGFIVVFLIVVGFIRRILQKENQKKSKWFGVFCGFLLIPCFASFIPGVVPMLVNAPFLNSFGTKGSAVIISEERTNSQLNENWVYRYSVILKTAEGEDVETEFTTMSATYYPPSNSIVLPIVGERFSVKYIPGAPHNFVILNNDEHSAHVIRKKCTDVSVRIFEAKNRYEASSQNQKYIQQYRQELSAYIASCSEYQPQLVKIYQQIIEELNASQ